MKIGYNFDFQRGKDTCRRRHKKWTQLTALKVRHVTDLKGMALKILTINIFSSKFIAKIFFEKIIRKWEKIYNTGNFHYRTCGELFLHVVIHHTHPISCSWQQSTGNYKIITNAFFQCANEQQNKKNQMSIFIVWELNTILF